MNDIIGMAVKKNYYNSGTRYIYRPVLNLFVNVCKKNCPSFANSSGSVVVKNDI